MNKTWLTPSLLKFYVNPSWWQHKWDNSASDSGKDANVPDTIILEVIFFVFRFFFCCIVSSSPGEWKGFKGMDAYEWDSELDNFWLELLMLCWKPIGFFCEEICAPLSIRVSKTTCSFTEKGTTWEDPSGQVMQMDSLPTDQCYRSHCQKQDLGPSIPGKWSRCMVQQKIQLHSERKPAVKILHLSVITAFYGTNYFSMAFDQILRMIFQGIKFIWYD